MSGPAMTALVMAREIRQRLRSKGFFVFTALLCLGIIGIGILNRVLTDDSPDRYDYAIVGEEPDGLDDALAATAKTLGIDVRSVSIESRRDAERALQDGDVDIVIDASTGELLSEHTPPDLLAGAVNAAWQSTQSRLAAIAAGLTGDELAEVLSPSGLKPTVFKTNNDSDDDVGRLVGTVTAILLFISINAFGGMVLTGVVEEKSTGVVEVLLSHVRAHHLLAGKVFGIGTVAMLQFAAALAAGAVALRIAGTSVPGAVWVGLPTTILWFIVGFVCYSTLYALAGSFVSRQEDAQSAAAPISMVFSAAYFAVFVLGANPYSTPARVVSVLPPFAPLLMPLRIAVGAASALEIAVAAVLLLVATAGMLRLAGAVYARTLLHRGSRLGWREALRMTSSERAVSRRAPGAPTA